MSTIGSIAYGAQIAAAALRHHLDPKLLAAVAAQETGGPGADSGRNVVGDGGHGHGLFQIDDRYHAFAATPAAMDPARNADYAAALIAENVRRYGGDLHKALSAYNAGTPDATGTTTDWGDGRQVGYAESVMRHYAALGGTPPAAVTGATADAQVADWRAAIPATNALQSLAAAPAAAFETSAMSGVPIAFPRPPATASTDRARLEAPLVLVDDETGSGDAPALVDPSRAHASS